MSTLNLDRLDITVSELRGGIRVTEGFVPFGSFRTFVHVAGEPDAPNPPLLLLHGGPGSTHNYFELLDRLAAETDRAVISYDQLGCGGSFVSGRPELWRAETWMDELGNLIGALGLKRFHLLGQSWGGMLAISYLADRSQEGVCSVILSSTLSDSSLWGREQRRMALALPPEEQAAIAEAGRTGDYSSAAYQAAIGHYMQLHCCDASYDPDAPECLRREKRAGSESYLHAWGPDELTPVGTLADWNYTDRLPELRLPALILSGSEDLCTPLIAKTMLDRLPDAEWQLMQGCRHMCFADDNSGYCSRLAAWLSAHD